MSVEKGSSSDEEGTISIAGLFYDPWYMLVMYLLLVSSSPSFFGTLLWFGLSGLTLPCYSTGHHNVDHVHSPLVNLLVVLGITTEALVIFDWTLGPDTIIWDFDRLGPALAVAFGPLTVANFDDHWRTVPNLDVSLDLC